MTVKETISFPIDDEEFVAFKKSFAEFQKQVAKTPDAFGKMAKGSKNIGDDFKAVTASLVAQTELMRKEADIQKNMAAHTQRAEFSWKQIAASSKTTASNIIGATTSLLKWTGIASVFGGLLGAWGFDHLAASAGAGRKSAQGLGVSYGEQQAFGVTFGRLIDPGTALSGASRAKGDISSEEAATLYGLGIDPTKGSTLDTAKATMDRVRQLAKQTPDNQLGILSSSRNLGAHGYDVETLRRLKGTSDEDYDKYGKDLARRSTTLGVTDPALKAMQDFDVSLDEAERKIKSVLIEGLSKLAKPLGELAEGTSDMIKSFLGSQGFKDVITSITKGLQEFAVYVKSEDFKKDMKDFVDSVAYAAHKMVAALKWLGLIPDNTPASPAVMGAFGGANPNSQAPANESWWDKAKKLFDPTVPFTGSPSGNKPINNPGNLRPVGASTGFQQFATPQAGILGMRDNLFAYQNVGVNTINDIVKKWAPSSENNTALYQKQIADWTGIDPAKKLDLKNDPTSLAAIMAAMIRKEGYGNDPNYSKQAISVTINNNNASQVAITSNAMGFPQPVLGTIPH